LDHTITVFLAFFAVMNPIANTAVFAGLTAGSNSEEKSQIAFKSLCITFAVILVFAACGKTLFHLFGITLPALRITGGILVFLIGYHMLHGSNSKLHTAADSEETDIAVSPLAVPLLAGPGTIATAMNYSASGGWVAIIVTLIAFSLLCVLTYFCFVFSDQIVNKIGENGLGIITRLMGLILAVIGTQMFIVGINEAFSKL
jgi:multiple antibiotic resistance protein